MSYSNNKNAYIHIPHEVMQSVNAKLEKERCMMKAAQAWMEETYGIHLSGRGFLTKIHKWREENGFPVYYRRASARETEEGKAERLRKQEERKEQERWQREEKRKLAAPRFEWFEDEDPRFLDVGLNRGRGVL